MKCITQVFITVTEYLRTLILNLEDEMFILTLTVKVIDTLLDVAQGTKHSTYQSLGTSQIIAMITEYYSKVQIQSKCSGVCRGINKSADTL